MYIVFIEVQMGGFDINNF